MRYLTGYAELKTATSLRSCKAILYRGTNAPYLDRVNQSPTSLRYYNGLQLGAPRLRVLLEAGECTCNASLEPVWLWLCPGMAVFCVAAGDTQSLGKGPDEGALAEPRASSYQDVDWGSNGPNAELGPKLRG